MLLYNYGDVIASTAWELGRGVCSGVRHFKRAKN